MRSATALSLSILLLAASCTSRVRSESPVLVDPAATAIRTCALTVVSFRTRDDGWVADHCGNVYRSRDAGQTWERDPATEVAIFGPPPEPVVEAAADDDRVRRASRSEHLEFIRWLSPTEGIAGGYIGARVMRTADAGRSWAKVPVPSDQWIYSVATAGGAIWICGSSGAIDQSADRGMTWHAVATPFDSSDRCVHLAFDAAGHGTGLGMNGSRWRSEDGGRSWSHVPGSPTAEEARASTPDRQVHSDAPGDVSAWGSVGTARLDPHGLRFEEPGKPPRLQPLVRRGGGARVPLRAVERLGPAAYGLSDGHLHYSDDGATWYVLSKLPARSERVTFLNPATVILESTEGVFRSEDGGFGWARSDQPELDRSDVERVRSGGKVPGQSPFDCVGTSQDAELRVVLAVRGCFGGTTSELSLVARGDAATLAGLLDHGGRRSPLGATPIDAAERRRIATSLGDAVIRLEQPLGCSSTTGITTRLTWRCEANGPERTLTFHGSLCGPGLPEGVAAGTTAGSAASSGYARANGLDAAAREILARHGVR